MCENENKKGKSIDEKELQRQIEAEKEEAERIVEEKTDTNGEVWDVVFYGIVSVWRFRGVAKELTRKIIEQVNDAEVSIKVYEWDYSRNKVYAKVEINKAIYEYLNIDTKTNDYEIHAVDEISFSTMTARTRKK